MANAFLALDAVFSPLFGSARFTQALRDTYAMLGECGTEDVERSLSAI